jgi:predicted ribosome quality control (RQC) complex YloA/Tae2 family protein
MDYFSLKKHVGELAVLLADRPLLVRAVDCSGRSLALHLKYRDNSRSDLVINLDSPDQGLRLTESAAEIEKNSSLVRTLNRLLIDARLVELDLAGSEDEGHFDRVVRLHFVAIDRFFGNRSDFYLLCEFTGRIADVFICDADYKILDRLSRTSNNLIGASYRLPESMPLERLQKLGDTELARIFAAPASTWRDRIGALSPALQATFQARLQQAHEQTAASVFRQLLAEILNDAQAYVYIDSGRVRAVSGYRLEHLNSCEEKVFARVNDALNWVSREIVAPRRIAEVKKRALAILAREIRQKQNLLDEQRALLEKYADSGHYRHYGDLLVANLYQIKSGSRFVELEDWHTGEWLRIELDPTRTPAAAAQRFFNLYKKAQRGIAEVEKRIKILREDLVWLREQLWLAETAENEADLLPDLKAFETVTNSRSSRHEKSGGRGSRRRPDFKPVLEISGCRYYAGRNARQNDALTFQLARRGDYWFHANDVPGAHVILRRAEGDISDTDLYRGAVLAAWFSFARDSSKVAVDYADVAHVKRIPGGGPGRVSYTNQRTLYVDPSIAKSLLEGIAENSTTT